MGFSLKIISGPEEGRTFTFERVQITIGRTIDNDVVLPDPGISRQHLSIRDKGGAFIIKDLGSSNGTLLNNKKITEEVIKAGDMITAGGAKIRFEGPTGAVSSRADAALKARSKRSNKPRARRRTSARGSGRAQASNRRPSARRAQRGAAKAKSSGGGVKIKSAGMRKKEKKPAAELSEGGEQKSDAGDGGRFSKIKFWIQSLDKKKKIILFGAIGLVLLLIIIGLASGGNQIVQSLRWYDDVELKPGEWAGNEPMSYGYKIAKRNCMYRAMYSFKYVSGRATMTYMVNGIDSKKELEILLNGVHIAYAPVTMVKWSSPQTMNLPRKHLLENQMNKVEFINRINRDDPKAQEEWAVAVGDITEQPLPPADKKKALEAFSNAAERYKNKNVSPSNLYRALEFYKQARDYMENIDEKDRPDEYQESVDMIEKINAELDKVYRASIFEAEKLFKYGKRKQALEAYRLLMLRFPNSKDQRNKIAKEAYVNLGGSLRELK